MGILFSEEILKDRPWRSQVEAILAVSQNGIVGSKSLGIPWTCSSDMKRFKKMTMGKVIVLGAKTYLTMIEHWPKTVPYFLDGRDIVVIYQVWTSSAKLIEDERVKLIMAMMNAGLKFGGRFLMIPIAKEEDARQLPIHVNMLLEDIYRFAGYQVDSPKDILIAGGSSIYELFYDKIAVVHATVINQLVVGPDLVQLGPKMIRLLQDGNVIPDYDAEYDKYEWQSDPRFRDVKLVGASDECEFFRVDKTVR